MKKTEPLLYYYIILCHFDSVQINTCGSVSKVKLSPQIVCVLIHILIMDSRTLHVKININMLGSQYQARAPFRHRGKKYTKAQKINLSPYVTRVPLFID